MEAQLHRPSNERNLHDEDPHHSAGLLHSNEGEHHGEKKSLLKKVKYKAKKIRQSVAKNGHAKNGHDHEHEQEHECRHDQVSEEDDDQDEEVENDPEVHGEPVALVCETPVIRGTALPKQTAPVIRATALRTQTASPEDTTEERHIPLTDIPNVGGEVRRPAGAAEGADTRHPPADVRSSEYNYHLHVNPSATQGGEVHRSAGAAMGPDMQHPPAEVHPSSEYRLHVNPSPTQAEQANVTATSAKIGSLDGFQEDPQSPANSPGMVPPSNYQSKVSDPTAEGGREADVEPLVRRFDNINVQDQAVFKSGQESESYTSGHDRMNVEVRSDLQPMPQQDQSDFRPVAWSESHTGSFDNKNVSKQEDFKPRPESKAHAADFDRMNVQERSDFKPVPQSESFKVSHDQFTAQSTPMSDEFKTESKAYMGDFDSTDVQDRSDLEPVPQSESYTGNHDQFAPQRMPMGDEFKPESNSPGESPVSPKRCDSVESDSMHADTASGKISVAAAVIADKAASAKNLVASNLGNADQGPEDQDAYKDEAVGPVTGLEKCDPDESQTTPLDATAGSISAVAPVITDKDVSAEKLVASKLGYADQAPEGENLSKRSDSGYKDEPESVSVKGYVVEELSPEDEGKALSETIMGTLDKKKDGTKEESEEIEAHLSTYNENRKEREDAMVTGSESSGTGMGTWLGKSTPKQSVGQSYEESISQERRLQESGN